MLPREELRVRLADLRIYGAAMKKILEASLYYLKVLADGHVLHKIGITTRPMSKRLAEIYRDLQSHYRSVEIEVINVWANRGNVERYFKYRYSSCNYPIGSLTEYFKFASPDETQAVESDLHQMQAKVRSSVDQDIMNGKQDSFLAALLADEQIKVGEVRISNSLESNLRQRFLAQPSSQKIIAALHQGDRLSDAAAIASVSIEVARKVVAVTQNH